MAESLDYVRGKIEEEAVGNIGGPAPTQRVSEVDTSPDGLAVYVTNCEPDAAPPRQLNKSMSEMGYSFIDWAVNGATGDNRAIFVYQEM